MKLELETLQKHSGYFSKEKIGGIILKNNVLFMTDGKIAVGYENMDSHFQGVFSVESLKITNKGSVLDVDISKVIPSYEHSVTISKDDIHKIIVALTDLEEYSEVVTLTIDYGSILFTSHYRGKVFKEYNFHKEHGDGFKYCKNQKQTISFNVEKLLNVFKFMAKTINYSATLFYDGKFDKVYISTGDFHDGLPPKENVSPFALIMPVRVREVDGSIQY